jgi:large subunit ribosomal protein L17
MHAHGIKQHKLSRTAGPRRALVRGLLDSLILYERIETTEARARALKPHFDKLVTKAKAQTLHSYRQILTEVINPVAGQKLYFDLVNGFTERNSGYTRIIKTGARRGDAAPMVVVELLLDDDYVKKAADTKNAAEEKAAKAAKPVDKKAEKKAAKKEEATVVRKTSVRKTATQTNVAKQTMRRQGDK